MLPKSSPLSILGDCIEIFQLPLASSGMASRCVFLAGSQRSPGGLILVPTMAAGLLIFIVSLSFSGSLLFPPVGLFWDSLPNNLHACESLPQALLVGELTCRQEALPCYSSSHSKPHWMGEQGDCSMTDLPTVFTVACPVESTLPGVWQSVIKA